MSAAAAAFARTKNPAEVIGADVVSDEVSNGSHGAVSSINDGNQTTPDSCADQQASRMRQ